MLDDLEKAAIWALSEYLIQNGHKALFVFGSQALPNNASYRAATGGASAWAQVNFADHNMYRMPLTAWATRWAYQKVVLDEYKDYFDRRGKSWADYIEIELTNEPSKITTPPTHSTTVDGDHTTSNTQLTVSDAANFSAGDWVTVQGSGAWQSFRIASKAGNVLTIAANTCSSNYGNTKSSTLAVNGSSGTTVTKCQYRASDADHFGVLDAGTYDEMDYEAANIKAAYPEIFLWGPGLAGGHPDSVAALFGSGRTFVGLCDGFNYHAYSINPGYYIGDEMWHGEDISPDDKGEAVFAREILALHYRCRQAYRAYTQKPIMCSEWGIAPATAQLSATGRRLYTPQIFSYLFAAALDIVMALDIRYAVLWGPDRQGLGNDKNSLDLISQESDMGTSATFLMHGAKAMRRSGTASTVVPEGFANSGSPTGVF